MSVINQVLNQLEQRGAHSAAEQPMVRAVLHTRRDFVMPLLAIGLILVAGAVAWQWVPSRSSSVTVESVVPKATQGFSHPEGAGNSPSSYELEKLTPQKQFVAAPASAVLAVDPPDEPLLPASRLSFELSSLPLPSTLRQDSGQALRGGKSKPAKNFKSAAETRTSSPVAPVRPKPIPATKAKVAAQASAGAVPMKQVSSAQRADAEFRRAAGLMQLGRIADAIAGYEAALRLDAGHDAARQASERVLLEGLNSKPDHTEFTMLLARLQVERGALEQATATLEKSLPFADTQADYRAFLAALLQRQNRNEEAISQYQIVAQHAPNNGVWLMGYGISLQAVQRNAEAKDAFRRALDTKTLSPELQAFVQQKLKGL